MSSFCVFFLFSACKPYVVAEVVVVAVIIYAKNLLCEKLSRSSYRLSTQFIQYFTLMHKGMKMPHNKLSHPTSARVCVGSQKITIGSVHRKIY